MPIGLVLVPLALAAARREPRPGRPARPPGLALASAGLFGLVWGLVRGNSQGWTSPEIVGSLAVGASSSRRSSPGSCGRPRRCCRCGSSAHRDVRAREPRVVSDVLRDVRLDLPARPVLPEVGQGYSPLAPGCGSCRRRLAPMFVAPVAGALSDRIGPRLIMGRGLALQAAGLALDRAVSRDDAYSDSVVPFVLAGVGHGPLLRAGRERRALRRAAGSEEGQASGANNAIRELGGVFGVAVLASVFAEVGGYESGAGILGRDDHRSARRVWRRRPRGDRRVRDARSTRRQEAQSRPRAWQKRPDATARAAPAGKRPLAAQRGRPVKRPYCSDLRPRPVLQTVQGHAPLAAGLRIRRRGRSRRAHRARGGRLLRPHQARRLIVGTGLTLQAVALAWIACSSRRPTRPVLGADRSVRRRGRRDGPLLRAGGERRPLRRCARARRARRRARTPRSGSSAASSASPSSPPCSAHVGRTTRRRRRSSTATNAAVLRRRGGRRRSVRRSARDACPPAADDVAARARLVERCSPTPRERR